MLKIRLQRVGRKHEPSFRLVLTDSKNSTKSGRFKEVLGSYDPRKIGEKFNAERIKHWMSVGAHPTDTVFNLLISHGILEGKKRNVLPKKTAPIKDAIPEETAPVKEAEEIPIEAPEEPPVSEEIEAANMTEQAPEPTPEAPEAIPAESDTMEESKPQ